MYEPAVVNDLPRLRPPGYAQGAAQMPMQRPQLQRPDALRPPQGGPGTAAPPTLAVRQPPGPSIQPSQSPGGPAPLASPFGARPGVPLPQVGGLIQQQLANPTRFDLPAFKSVYDFAKGDLEQEAERSRQGVTADAARRGVYHSTAPDTMTGGNFDIGERFNRGLGTLASNLTLEQARTGGQDFNSAMGNAFRFMENQQAADQFGANLGLNTAQLGYGGSPDIQSILAQMSGQPLPQLGKNPLEALGSSLATFQPRKAT